MKIALVDDELTQLMNLKNLLATQLQTLIPESSHLIDTYRSGQSFLDHWSAGQYDVIILDIFMGGITGVEVAKEIADFVLGDAVLPEYVNDEDTLTALTKIISANAIIGTNEKPTEPHTEPTSREA